VEDIEYYLNMVNYQKDKALMHIDIYYDSVIKGMDYRRKAMDARFDRYLRTGKYYVFDWER
jgi:hypothetical protein